MCVCALACARVCMYVCMYVASQIVLPMSAISSIKIIHVFVYTCIKISARACVCVCVCVCVCMHSGVELLGSSTCHPAYFVVLGIPHPLLTCTHMYTRTDICTHLGTCT